MPRSLYAKIALSFASIVVALGGLLGWFGYHQAKQHQHRILQQVNWGLAKHIASQPGLINGDKLQVDPRLFDDLMAVNPNIEVYLLDNEGRILRFSQGGDALVRDRVSLDPIRAAIAGKAPPVFGDNPRQRDGTEIFSVAPIAGPDGDRGYLYIVLLNSMYRSMVEDSWRQYLLRSGVFVGGLSLFAALVFGFVVFYAITLRLRNTIDAIDALANDGADVSKNGGGDGASDEIERLDMAFSRMRDRLQAQMFELKRQDELRRELVANVSHDLRTPLTAMQGYLEAMKKLDDAMSRDDRKRYLDVAVRQSIKVSKLAQQLFELAKLECEETQPQHELFSISELVNDIAQKFSLAAGQKSISFETELDAEPVFVYGDIGMIERVVTNLIDNAIRHTPENGNIRLEAVSGGANVEVKVSDTGQGIPAEQMPGLLERGSPLRQMAARRGGGLGLLIANRILDLHGSEIQATSRIGEGTSVSFVLPLAEAN